MRISNGAANIRGRKLNPNPRKAEPLFPRPPKHSAEKFKMEVAKRILNNSMKKIVTKLMIIPKEVLSKSTGQHNLPETERLADINTRKKTKSETG